MAAIDLRVGFSRESHLRAFLLLLRYMLWCGNVGHSGSVSVHFDGDGDFKMGVTVDPGKEGERDLRDVVEFDGEDWKRLKTNHYNEQWKKEVDCVDHNEFSISMGD